jgi:hypothetical protein
MATVIAGRIVAWTWSTYGTTRTLWHYGRYGVLFIRWRRSSSGSPPKRRTVFTVPEMDVVVGVLDHYVAEVRPRGGPRSSVGRSNRRWEGPTQAVIG